jgi:DNA replication and repair protein RecF
MSSRVSRFGLGGLRVFAEADFVPGSGLSWILGANGAGKTSVIEAAYLLGHGRSFRSAQMESLLAEGMDALWVSAGLVDESGSASVVGVSRTALGEWSLRVEGRPVQRLTDVARRFPVLCFEPGSHQWVAGPSERRRRLLDWGAFHVEHAAPDLWSEYQRALRQRNAALRMGDPESAEAWEPVLDASGQRITAHRAAFHARWNGAAQNLLGSWSSEFDRIEFVFRRGWGEQHASLADALASQRERDLGLGYTYAGPHRCDLAIRWRGSDARERLSRGQAKLVVLALLIAQAQCYRQRHGSSPLLLLDDLCSELDSANAGAVLSMLREHEYQAWVTGVERPSWASSSADALFHVEQGSITPLI